MSSLNNLEDATTNKGVSTLLGDPKKAIMKLSIPVIIAMSMQTLYNLADAIWVSGLGTEALSAVGYFFPFFMLLIAISNGLGVGVGAAISRWIGARQKEKADATATSGIILLLICSVVLTVPFVLLTRNIFQNLGVGQALEMTVSYSRIMFFSTIFLFFAQVGDSIMRSEGDAKRTMLAMLLGAVLNIFLDPIFIYRWQMPWFGGSSLSIGLNLGVSGAAYASVLSMAISCIIRFNWLFIKKSTYVSFRFRGFKFQKFILGDIAGVGVPAALSQMSMSILMLLLTIIINLVGKNNGVAVFTTGWRVANIGILPLIGMSTAVVSVCGASFGSGDFSKLRVSFLYALRVGFIIEIVLGLVTFMLAPAITKVFTWSEGAAVLAADLTGMLKIVWGIFPAFVFGMFTASMFQGVGKGVYSLLITVIRTVFLVPCIAYLFAVSLGMELTGVWLGMVVASWIGAAIALVWASIFLKGLEEKPVFQVAN